MNNITILIISILLLVSGCSKTKPEPVEYLPTFGETVTIFSLCQNSVPTRHFIEIFPKEVYLGDTIYLIAYDENVSAEVIARFLDHRHIPMYEYHPEQFILSSTLANEEYNWMSEHPATMSGCYAIGILTLYPGEKRPFSKTYLEFPPLEDLENSFWKELVTNISQDGIVCNLRIKYQYRDHLHEYHDMDVEQEILVKPRPESEMALLQKWYTDTPEKLFPKVDRGCKVPYNEDLKSSGQSNIKVAGKEFDPWMFIRLGNRKPSDPNNPTTLAGWRKLESSLTPSTMRDEIRFTRLQLEYYDAKKGAKTDEAKTEFVDWLKSLPEVQRNIMISSLVSNQYRFRKTALEDKNRELLRSLSMM